jgi:hypothetical protein
MAKRSGKNVFHPNSQANNFATMKKAKTITTIDSGDRRKKLKLLLLLIVATEEKIGEICM